VLLVLWSFAAIDWNITIFNNGIDRTQCPDGKSEEVGPLRKKVVLPQVLLVAL